MQNQTNILIFENIRSAENVGAMFRTADAVGIDKIYLIGISPSPIDRFGRKRSDIAKSALGGEESVKWEYRKEILPLIEELKKEGFKIIALEQDEKSINYKETRVGEKNVFIVGNEVSGVSKEVLQIVDYIAEIPMKGSKESLNVSVSLGVFLYGVLRI